MKKQNSDVIKNAFKAFKDNKDEIIRAGMYGLLEDAVQMALDAHDDKHKSHIEIGDTYGWMLVHNGKIEEIAVVATDKNEGKATQMLKAKKKDLPKKGWIGVVMAGMEPASFFSVIYEMGMLDYSLQMTEQNFFQYFNEI